MSFGTPSARAQEMVYRAALKKAKVAPAEVSYVETHGTGTAVGKYPLSEFDVLFNNREYEGNIFNPDMVNFR